MKERAAEVKQQRRGAGSAKKARELQACLDAIAGPDVDRHDDRGGRRADDAALVVGHAMGVSVDLDEVGLDLTAPAREADRFAGKPRGGLVDPILTSSRPPR